MGGARLYTSAMTSLAETAVSNKRLGMKEVYVFRDWGFFTGFDYLTMNKIPFLTAFDFRHITSYYKNGSEIVVCYWKKNDTSYYEREFAKISGGKGTMVRKDWTDKNGQVAFYEIRLTQSKKQHDQ